MSLTERPLRSDAARNRKRVLAAAVELFRERGLDVGVAEIAQRAGVGRGTLFRNFPSKDDLIAAVVVERVHDALASGAELLQTGDPGEALFQFLEEIAGRQQLDRALFEAVGDEWLSNPAISAAHEQMLELLGQLLARAQAHGTVRPDVTAVDVLMLFKGMCEAACAFAHLGGGVMTRQLDLIRASLTAPPSAAPLRGRSPTLAELRESSAPPPRAARRAPPSS